MKEIAPKFGLKIDEKVFAKGADIYPAMAVDQIELEVAEPDEVLGDGGSRQGGERGGHGRDPLEHGVSSVDFRIDEGDRPEVRPQDRREGVRQGRRHLPGDGGRPDRHPFTSASDLAPRSGRPRMRAPPLAKPATTTILTPLPRAATAHYGAISYMKEIAPKFGLKIDEKVFAKGADIYPAMGRAGRGCARRHWRSRPPRRS
jgi:hypothetical protein